MSKGMIISTRTAENKPQRTCIACRQVKDKGELIRLVRIKSGIVEVDPVSKKVGRGAYLCRSRDCWESGLKSGKLERSLRTTLSRDSLDQLLAFAEDLFRGAG